MKKTTFMILVFISFSAQAFDPEMDLNSKGFPACSRFIPQNNFQTHETQLMPTFEEVISEESAFEPSHLFSNFDEFDVTVKIEIAHFDEEEGEEDEFESFSSEENKRLFERESFVKNEIERTEQPHLETEQTTNRPEYLLAEENHNTCLKIPSEEYGLIELDDDPYDVYRASWGNTRNQEVSFSERIASAILTPIVAPLIESAVSGIVTSLFR